MDWYSLGVVAVSGLGIAVLYALLLSGRSRRTAEVSAVRPTDGRNDRPRVATGSGEFSMSAWLREIAGWVLLGTGLAMFAVVYAVFLLNRRVVEAVLFGFAGLAVFRGGLQLLKVAMAARASRDIRREFAATTAASRKVRPQLGSQHPHGRPRKTVVPGPAAANGDR